MWDGCSECLFTGKSPVFHEIMVPSMIFAKQKSLKPGGKGLSFTSNTHLCCLRGKGCETLYLLSGKRAAVLLSFSGCVQACTAVSSSQSCLLQASPSGGEPGLNLQGQLIQGVLVDDEALVQQVLSHLGRGNTEIHRNLPAFFPLQHVLRSPRVVFLRNPNSCLE